MSIPDDGLLKQVATLINYTPRSLSLHAYETMKTLCDTIIPTDSESGGAIEAGVPELIDLVASLNEDYQLQLVAGLNWLDAACVERYGKSYLACVPAQQQEILDLIAFRKNAKQDPRLNDGIEFFSALRKNTVDAFFTSDVRSEVSRFQPSAHFAGHVKA
jgi:gluconate 2-dehydrogenase gamma chain